MARDSFTVQSSALPDDARLYSFEGAEALGRPFQFDVYVRVPHADDVDLNAPSTGPDDFYSPHAAGANFLFADGSVRFVKETIQIRVYRSLCTRDLGELVDPSSY